MDNTPPATTSPNGSQVPIPEAPTFNPAAPEPKKKWILLLCAVILLVAIGSVFYWLGHKASKASSTLGPNSSQSAIPTTAKIQRLQLNTAKNYGNKYANGLLPVGDGKYVTHAAKKGYVYACSTYAQNLKTDQGGASTRGPWFTGNNTEYDINKKTHVRGNLKWDANFTNKISGSTRIITSNDLPTHATGIFPIASTDPAYTYDHNPNSIKSQSLSYSLPARPTYSSPTCMGGQAGIMLTGVALFNGFDAGGRDAGAWEVQDNCDGHPEKEGLYHYHTLTTCISNISVTTVIGFALDGFPITGPKIGTNNILTTDDLDECHGITSQLMLDNQKVTTYHYVMTQDFPYSVSCFRAKAIQTAPLGSQQAANTQLTTTTQLPPPPGTSPPY